MNLPSKRIPVVEGQDPALVVRNAGEYYGPVMGYTGDKPAVFFLLPCMNDESRDTCERALGAVVSPPHTFTENPDGTLTIRNSILRFKSDGSPGWHGYLTDGIWTEV